MVNQTHHRGVQLYEAKHYIVNPVFEGVFQFSILRTKTENQNAIIKPELGFWVDFQQVNKAKYLGMRFAIS
jgi:hypothetical protein